MYVYVCMDQRQSFGFQADSFLYSMAPTYSLGIPLIANGKGGDASTFHQVIHTYIHTYDVSLKLITLHTSTQTIEPLFHHPQRKT